MNLGTEHDVFFMVTGARPSSFQEVIERILAQE